MHTAVQNKRALISLLKANGQKLRSYGVSSLSVFGSFITGKYNADSDVDLLVDFDPKQKSYDNFMDLSFFLEDLLGRKVENDRGHITSHLGNNMGRLFEYFILDSQI
ncbi:nucleotidyltransferase family protein [Pedobacter nyackensis]|uniref:Polymerase nucleotidyl transferase domain-containing protein n=1 Tax=Pedobacter nyackensis TaxID=475255 RepID=A0A1W2A924_9SPHI|nr:nucleotidyltransferase domain-containing protein [Pedobacter nyackensis]SMC57225.1 hypothetical protein SAMN04488101_101328 [Pedobacter nyackensis]